MCEVVGAHAAVRHGFGRRRARSGLALPVTQDAMYSMKLSGLAAFIYLYAPRAGVQLALGEAMHHLAVRLQEQKIGDGIGRATTSTAEKLKYHWSLL